VVSQVDNQYVRLNLPLFKAILAVRGVTQRELSRRAGVPETDLSAGLRGRRPMTREVAARIARILDIDLERLTAPEHWEAA